MLAEDSGQAHSPLLLFVVLSRAILPTCENFADVREPL